MFFFIVWLFVYKVVGVVLGKVLEFVIVVMFRIVLVNSYDFIIVGGGIFGLIVVDRLLEDLLGRFVSLLEVISSGDLLMYNNS